MRKCKCHENHTPKHIALTGGPGAGKTAILGLVRHYFCQHVVVLPEAATLLFSGGFPRGSKPVERAASQRAIFYVQRELERMANEVGEAAVIVSDRGTVDGAAYWPGPGDLFSSVGTTRDAELARYDMVIHLQTPPAAVYNHDNPQRVESPDEAQRIDQKITEVWSGHQHSVFVEANEDFLAKAQATLNILRDEVPHCCRNHVSHFNAKQPKTR